MDNISAALSGIREQFPNVKVSEWEAMRRHTTFRVGGAVRAMVFPENGEELESVSRICLKRGAKWMVVGRGSNLLFSDEPHDMIVIGTERLAAISQDGEAVLCEAGASLAKVASFCQERGLTGFEFAHGIPGSVGGAMVMNAGAYGGEMKDVVQSVTVLDPGLNRKTITNNDCGFSYRHSELEGRVVLGARLRLTCGDSEEIHARMEELAKRRREKQPLNYPSAGSTFKRPRDGYAAKMIEEAGLKGYRVGDAQVSEKHAGFVVNLGSASFDDVLAVMEHIQEKVLERTGVLLEPEVKVIN